MSKLYNMYLVEKRKSNDILLFESGIFYIALAEDAILLSNTFGFKLTNLNSNIKKCGFPISSLDKYLKIFNASNLSIKIINNEQSISNDEKFEFNKKEIQKILNSINSIDINNLSVSEIYKFLETLKNDVRKLIKV